MNKTDENLGLFSYGCIALALGICFCFSSGEPEVMPLPWAGVTFGVLGVGLLAQMYGCEVYGWLRRKIRQINKQK